MSKNLTNAIFTLVLATALFHVSSIHAMSDGNRAYFKLQLDKLLPELVAIRHDLHAHPEIGFNEFRTAGVITNWLNRFPNITYRTGVAKTGIVATLGADKPGPCLAFRADMDALPMDDKCGQPYASRYPGMAHTCGHDGHVTCLLGAAAIMASAPERLSGPVRFIFQPAEEGGAGAKFMVEEGALESPRPVAIFALHTWPSLKAGYVGLRSGPHMASSDPINITIHGKGAHAAYPHNGVDPIVAGAYVITALQTVVSRTRTPTQPAVLTIGAFHAGTVRNIIPEKSELLGTLRTLSEEERDRLHEAIPRVIERTVAAFGATADVDIKKWYPVNINNPELSKYALKTIQNAFGRENVTTDIPMSMGGEDFAYYTQHIPGCYMRLGNAPTDGSPGVTSLHNPALNFNDDALPTGIAMHCALAWGWEGR